MKKMMFVAAMLLACVACSKDDGNEETVTTSPITIEYLTSNLTWYYAPDEGLTPAQQYAGVEQYSFVRVGETLSGAYRRDKKSENQHFVYTLSAPSVVLTFDDGTKRTLTVYKLNKSNSGGLNYLQINGLQYAGALNGLDTSTW